MQAIQFLTSTGPAWRRCALVGIMLAFFLGAVAEPVSLAEQAQARTAIYANVSSSIEIEAPSEIQWNDLCLGTNVSPPQRIRVRSNKPFTLKMRSVTRTHLAEYDLDSQQWVTGGRSLSETLKWRFSDDESQPLSVSRSDVDIAAANPATTSSGQAFDICFVQEIVFADEQLEDGKVYRIDVIFTAVQDV
ncbi:MAG TPA: hypothetical protein PK128_03405 [Bacillota bacterium]|nr:hypothetical protein [Bacillota bacterium]